LKKKDAKRSAAGRKAIQTMRRKEGDGNAYLSRLGEKRRIKSVAIAKSKSAGVRNGLGGARKNRRSLSLSTVLSTDGNF
jgi:predicted amidohydrolase YtcJ